MSRLFSPLRIRSIEFRNRIFVSPMCQYSCVEGVPTDWHLVHLGSRAVGGAGLVIAEATGISPAGRISPNDAGLWNEVHAKEFGRVAAFISAQGAVPGIQLGHAGRKASTAQPWRGGGPVDLKNGGWVTEAPSAIPFADGYPTPRAMSGEEIDELVKRYVESTRLARSAGFQVIEIHMAHGYLMHQFLSPLSNRRTDEYGGDSEGRMRVPLKVASAVRDAWPNELPLFVRISATDWAEGGWDLAQSVTLSKRLKEIGVDLIDCSSGGLVPSAKIPAVPGYQVPFAAAIRREAKIATGAVGLITEPQQAEEIISAGSADAVLLARQMLRDPYWPLHAAQALGVDLQWPVQYSRGRMP